MELVSRRHPLWGLVRLSSNGSNRSFPEPPERVFLTLVRAPFNGYQEEAQGSIGYALAGATWLI